METDKSSADSITTLVGSDGCESPSMVASASKSNQCATYKPTLLTPNSPLSITSLKLVNGLPPSPVGREFVRQYYTMMRKSPQSLYRFYSANASLTFGNNPIIIGQDEIRKDIKKRELHNSHACIIKVDSQPTLGSGVVVQVIGELSLNNEPLRPFTQTFVLSPHVPKNFFVFNEIFRYQDELYPEINFEAINLTTAANQFSKTMNADQVKPGIPHSLAPSVLSQEPVNTKSALVVKMNAQGEIVLQNESMEPIWFVTRKNQIKISSLSVGVQANSSTEEIKKTVGAPDMVNEKNLNPGTFTQTDNVSLFFAAGHSCTDMKTSSTQNSNRSSHASSILTEYHELKSQPLLQHHPHTSQNTENFKNISLDKTQQPCSKSSAPPTYANIFKSVSGLPKHLPDEDMPVGTCSDMKPVFIPSATFTPTTSSVAPSRGAENSAFDCPSLQQQRRFGQRRERFDESLQLFLGNLPVSATVEALTPIFERYGTIVELRVLSKTAEPGTRRLPNYGFLTYSSPQAVLRCLDDGPFYFPENAWNSVRLNVRPKTSHESRNAKQLTNNDHYGVYTRNTGNYAEISNGKGFGKWGRSAKNSEQKRNEEIFDIRRSALPSNHKLQKSLQVEDWPQLCGVAAERGGGVRNSVDSRRKNDSK